MRRALLTAALGVVLALSTACSNVHPSDFVAGKSRVKVDTPALAAFKKNTDIPNCPKVSGNPVDQGMPGVTLACLGGGRSVDVAGLRGPMIVNFWQSTCHPCRQEMPALASYARTQSAVQVLGIDILDVQPGAALQLARDSKVGYPLIADPAGNLVGQGPVPRNIGLPFTAYVDKAGRVVHVETGALTSVKAVAAAAKRYLGVGG